MGIHLRLSKSAYNVRKRIAKGDHAAIMKPRNSWHIGALPLHTLHYRFTSYIHQNAANWVLYIVGLHLCSGQK